MFSPAKYGSKIAEILRFGEDGQRAMPLVLGGCTSTEAKARLSDNSAADLFPDARAPEAALAGLFLYFGCFDESHSVAQDLPSAEGSYWHGILHRQEPDAGNAAYWFRRVGQHAVFPLLARAARTAVDPMASGSTPFIQGDRWDPFAFIDFCDAARRKPHSQDSETAMLVQLIEWQLLFDYCATPAS